MIEKWVLGTKAGSDVLNRLCQNTAQKILQFLGEASYFTSYVDKSRAHRALNTLPRVRKQLDSIYKEIISSGLAEAVIVHDSFDRVLGYVANMAEISIDQALLQ
ncbi:MAG: hypothetical protein Q7S32_01875 [bacterium]|nr:hypothetical protein [bacterium]